MKKIIKKWGDSFVLVLSPEEIKIYGLQEGSMVDVELAKINKKEEEE